MSHSNSSLPFANYHQLSTVVPKHVWRTLRVASVLTALLVALLLIARPDIGTPVFWGLLIPALPATFMLAPGAWRNVCPLATSNQAPRRHGITRALTNQRLSQGTAYPIGITLLICAVIGRKLLFNDSGVATAALLVGAMAAAFIGGLLFKGKSGWCSSICPLLPVQRLYGQTPFVRVANTQCEPCVGCSKNCYDFNPGSAYLADQYDTDPAYRNFRRFFAGVFPGLILGYYLVPTVTEIGSWPIVGRMLVFMASSLMLFTIVDLMAGKTRNLAPVVFAALAFSVYYWFAAPLVAQTTVQLTGLVIDRQIVGGLRTLAACCSLIWIARSLHVERLFLREQVRKSSHGEIKLAPIVIETVRLNRKVLDSTGNRPATVDGISVSQPVPLDETPPGIRQAPLAPDATSALRIEPTGETARLSTGQTLLDALESCNAPINPGCRAGACGADPIAVTNGNELLCPIGSDERETLQRLGCASNTRLACMARVRSAGPITIELKPHRPDAAAARPDSNVSTPVPREFDRSIRRIVIVGNGVAGLTAADHVRRNHPECEIHLIGRENHSAYNRMAIAKLICTPTGVNGLQLLPEEWYAEHRITAWLNTQVTNLDTSRRKVTLATRESLSYDRLILATGSSARVPPLDGFGVDGTFVLRDADDAMALRDYLQRRGGTSAVVLGAGLLGLEAAQALSQLGTRVKVLSKSGQLLDRQIDSAASELLAAHLATKGIDVVADAKIRAIEPDTWRRVAAVILSDGRRLPADAFVVCAGSSTNIDLARSAGLSLGHGIKVDARMRTSDPNVYAAGDAAEFEGATRGLWSVALAQGEIAALNALGIERTYRGHVPVTVLKVSGIDVRSAGAVHATLPGGVELVQEDLASGIYRKLVIADSGKVVGAVLVGSPAEAEEIVASVRQQAPVSALRELLARGHWRKQAVARAA